MSVAVIVANTIKAICILLTLLDDGQLFVTLGDAICSFLRNPDDTSPYFCSWSKKDYKASLWRNGISLRTWSDRRHCRGEALTGGLWFTASWCCVDALLGGGVLLFLALRTQHGSNIASLWRFGQGSEDPSHLIKIVLPGIVANSLVANVPQLVLTQFYLIYSNIYTRKAVAAEWARYAQSPRPLRVTHAQGSQKSSHWLGLPFRYGLLIQIGSALLHWLASQSIFVVSLIFYDYTGQPTLVLNDSTVPDPYSSDKKDAKMSSEVYRTGFSSNAIILAILLGAVLILLCWIDDLRALPRGMPMVGTCSILISAACETVPRRSRPGWRDDLVLRPLQWGVIRIEESCAGRGEWATGASGEVGRGREEAGGALSYCGFTDDADSVVPLVDGELVASDRVVFENGMTMWRVENEVLDSCTDERDNVSPLGPT